MEDDFDVIFFTLLTRYFLVDPGKFEPFEHSQLEIGAKLKLRTELLVYTKSSQSGGQKGSKLTRQENPPTPGSAVFFLLLFGAKVSKFERRDPTNLAAQPLLEDCDRHPSEASSKSTVLGPQFWDVKIKYSNLSFLRSQSSM